MTRQFNIDPRLLCKQHLLGEHSEMHEGVGLIESENTDPDTVQAQLEGQARAGNIDTTWFVPRHEALAAELKKRGGNHQSPLEYDDELAIGVGAVCPDESAGSLMKCPSCRERIQAFYFRIDDDDVLRDDRDKRIAATKWYPDRQHPFDAELEAVATEFQSTCRPCAKKA